MALTPDSSSDAFVREVDENLRRDQAQALAKRYGTIIAGALLLLRVKPEQRAAMPS